jgi:hypothetical protein
VPFPRIVKRKNFFEKNAIRGNVSVAVPGGWGECGCCRIRSGDQIKERLVIRLDHKAPEQPSPEVCSWSKYNSLGKL